MCEAWQTIPVPAQLRLISRIEKLARKLASHLRYTSGRRFHKVGANKRFVWSNMRVPILSNMLELSSHGQTRLQVPLETV